MTIELPDSIAAEIAALLPEDERTRFAVAAVADAVHARRRQAEQDATECAAAVEDALADMDAGRGLVSFDAALAGWHADKAARRSANP